MATKKAAKAEEKKDLVELMAIEPILHNGDFIDPGELFTATPKQAVELIKKRRAEEN